MTQDHTSTISETIKKGRYRIYNGSSYDVIHLETTAEQVIETEDKKFTSPSEKNKWNSKAEGNHNHDELYAKLSNTYNIEAIDNKLKAKAELVHTHVATQVIEDSTHRFVSDSEKNRWNDTFTKEEVNNSLNTKAEKTHTHKHVEILGLGDAATKNVGTLSGQIPILNEQGKIEESVLPKIAINEVFSANSTEDAMGLPVDIGDILILNQSAIAASLEAKSNFSYIIDDKEMTLSKEYIEYLIAGKMTYLCISKDAPIFEDKFRPLQSSVDTISKGEVDKLLATKVNSTTFEDYKTSVSNLFNTKVNNDAFDSYKSETSSNLNTKVNISSFDEYKKEVTKNLSAKVNEVNFTEYKALVIADLEKKADKTTVESSLGTKVDKENGKTLSANDFTNELKSKLEGIESKANNYTHPSNDGNLHVPATGTSNNGKVLMAGPSESSISWQALTADNVADSNSKKFVTPDLISKWNSKAEGGHSHPEYRPMNDSLSTVETRSEISKLKTIISSSQPGSGVQAAGAIWIEESK